MREVIEEIESEVKRLGGVVGYTQRAAVWDDAADKIKVVFELFRNGGYDIVTLEFSGYELVAIPSRLLKKLVAAKLDVTRVYAEAQRR